MPELTHFMKMEDKRFLGSWDLCVGEDEKGSPLYTKVIGTIAKIKREKVYEPNTNTEKVVTVCEFKELKPMILNKTNLKAIEKALRTPFIEKWNGQRISIAVKKVKMRGELVDALRIEDIAPKAEKDYFCAECGVKITENIARRTYKRFGEMLCAECGKGRIADDKSDDSTGETD